MQEVRNKDGCQRGQGKIFLGLPTFSSLLGAMLAKQKGIGANARLALTTASTRRGLALLVFPLTLFSVIAIAPAGYAWC